MNQGRNSHHPPHLGAQLLLTLLFLASHHMDPLHTPRSTAPPAAPESLISTRIDHTAVLLREASSTAARTLGSSFPGVSRDGGAPYNGGELHPLFHSFGSGFVNVGSGGLRGSGPAMTPRSWWGRPIHWSFSQGADNPFYPLTFQASEHSAWLRMQVSRLSYEG